jgi:hypothetical protein
LNLILIGTYQNIDVSTSVESVGQPFSGSAEEQTGDALLDVLEPEDGRSDGPEQFKNMKHELVVLIFIRTTISTNEELLKKKMRHGKT